MFGEWMCLVLLDLVILSCSTPGPFNHTKHDKNPWHWGQDWQHDWWQTTKPARLRTTTPKSKAQSTPVPTLPQPTIRAIDIRLGEMTPNVNSPTPNPRPITFIQEETPPRVKEQNKPQDSESIGPSDSIQNADVDTLVSAENSESKPIIQSQTSASKNDEAPEATAPETENDNNFGIAITGDIETADDFKTEDEDTFTEIQDKPAAEDNVSFQIAPISTIDIESLAKTEASPKPDSDYYEQHLSRIDEALGAILGNGKVAEEAPLLNERQSMWHVAIYEKKNGRYEHICGGSLIKADIVISAGHCFWTPVWQLPTTLFRVAAGKLYPRYDDPRDTTAQFSEIRNITISDMEEPCMQPDLGLVHLVTAFKYTSAVRPVCFSLDWKLETRQLREGSSGVVASWAAVEDGACRSLRHSWLSLPFIKNEVCQYEVNYKTTGRDRICAGRTNDTTECPTDSGNGLVFYQDRIPYLRGVATNLPVHRQCARFHTRSFANINVMTGILRRFKAITDVYDLGECENLYRNMTQDGQKNNTNGGFGEGFVETDPPEKEPEAFFTQEIGGTPVPTLPDSSAPALQWHVGVYSTRWAPYVQICGGSLVKRDFVISAAHCFWDDAAGVLPARQFAVAGGKLFRPWNNTQDAYAQHSDISEIILPARFRGAATSFQDDIAILRLTSPFTYAPGVQSVCVDFSREFEMKQLRPGNVGTILGWGLTAENESPSQRLTYLQLPYVDVEDCYADSEPAFLKYITSDKICAGDTATGKALCRGDSGGGFVIYSHNTPHLHGVASTAAGNQHLCNAFTMAAFTSLYSHRAFLRDNIPGIDKECSKPETTTESVTENGMRVATDSEVYTNMPYFPYPNHFVCNCNCKN